MKTSVDDLVASLDRAPEVPGPGTVGARNLLAAVTAEEPLTEAARPRRVRRPRLLAGAVAMALAVAAFVGLNGAGPTRLSGYANAAVDIEHTGDVYVVRVKDAYADSDRFTEAFAKLGVRAKLSIVPVSPASERKVLAVGDLGTGPADEILDGSVDVTVPECPSDGRACPLTVELSGDVRRSGLAVMLGRAARPGETYHDGPFQQAPPPPALRRLEGRTAGAARAGLRHLGMTVVYMIGEFAADGSGDAYEPPADWRPGPDRRVARVWLHSAHGAVLMITPAAGDPDSATTAAPDPTDLDVPRGPASRP
ncbi:hypothetical protein [Actinomadura hibisca]|uniref:hypothetical protein n=1 Tax=Actinomadura hibisca TaxID=68565 RepID=UPI000830E0B1|nr:hypothetical protein [Actinomadura hibisca]